MCKLKYDLSSNFKISGLSIPFRDKMTLCGGVYIIFKKLLPDIVSRVAVCDIVSTYDNTINIYVK